MKIKIWHIVLAVLLAIGGIFYFGYVKGGRASDRANSTTISGLNNTLSSYSVMLTDNKTFISQKEQEIKTQKQAIKDGEIEKATLRKIHIDNLSELSKLSLQIDTLLKNAHNNGQIVIIHDTVTNEPRNAILLPFVVTKNDKWLSLKDSTDIKGKTSVSLKMNLDIDIMAGIDTDSKKPTAKVSTTNPYISILNITSIKMDVPKVRKYGIGLQAGYGIGNTFKPTPYIGIGLQWSIIRF